jgi:hypothetical protein
MHKVIERAKALVAGARKARRGRLQGEARNDADALDVMAHAMHEWVARFRIETAGAGVAAPQSDDVTQMMSPWRFGSSLPR